MDDLGRLHVKMSRPFRFFNLDLHISVIADVKDVLSRLYGDAITVDDWSISGHTWVFQRPPTSVQVVNGHTWKYLTTAMVEQFVDTYKEYLSTYDGFIVTHTPVFCRLFESFGKPIVMVNSCRYDQPYCMPHCYNPVELDALNQCLKRLDASGLLVAISNNLADRDYLYLATGISSVHLPSLCLYTGIRHDRERSRETKLTVSCTLMDNNSMPFLPSLSPKPQSPYEWDDLINRRGLVCFPYEVSTMSLFEHYSAGVPLYLPSKRFYRKLLMSRKAALSIYNNFCYWRIGDPKVPQTLAETQSVDWWLDRCDFYDPTNMPMIHFFDSWEELRHYTETADVRTDTEEEAVQKHLKERQEAIETQWRALIDPLLQQKK